MEQLPASLTYSASKQSLRLNRFQVRPTSSSSGGPSTTFRFNLPSKSLVDLSSFSIAFDCTLSGLVNDAVNFANASLPWGHRLFSSVKVYVGGQLVSGGLSNHYDILASALAKASAGEDWVLSRMNEHALELIANRDDMNAITANNGATSKSASYIVSDFLGAFRGNGAGRSVIDTSLWGDIVIEVVTSTEASIKQVKGGTGVTTAITYNLSNVEAYVNCITQTTPLYIKLITMLLDEKEAQIRFPYQNFVTTISGSGSNARFQVNSNSIDMMVVCPLSENYNSLHGTAGVSNIDPSTQLNCTRYRFDSGKTATTPADSKGCAMQIQIGSDTFPKLPIDNGLHVSNITQDALFSNSLYSQNLLFNDVDANASKYSRNAFLNENFVWINGFCDAEGWSTKVLTGVDSASQNLDIIVNTSAIGANGSLFMGALTTSMLVFDTKTGVVSVVP